MRAASTGKFDEAQAWLEIFPSESSQPGEYVEVKLLTETHGSLFGTEIAHRQLPRPAFPPFTQHAEHALQIVRRVIHQDVGIQREARVAVEDDGETADVCESTPAVASAANNFPYWERLWFCAAESVMANGLGDEALHLLELAQTIQGRRHTSNRFPDGLLHGI